MPRSGYLNYRLTDKNAEMLDRLCEHIGLDPTAQGARTKGVTFALQFATLFEKYLWVYAAALNAEVQQEQEEESTG